MRERGDRAYGPYKHRDKWRVVVVGADGVRTAATYASKASAYERIAEVNEKTAERTVSNAIDAYLAENTAKTRSKQTIGYRLRGITGVGDHDRLLTKLTPSVAREMFTERALETSGDTQFHELASARMFAAWCIGKGWLRVDPFAGLKPTKGRKRGKEQLRIDEARKLLETCLAEDSKDATAVALTLLCSVRASAITNRTVRDLDDGARVLWIEEDKTEAGDRRLEVPEVLRARLAKLAAGRSGGERLFGEADRHWLRYHTHRLCKLAGVPLVCPHGLRGTHASIARPVVPVEHVARVLGHSGTAITQRHYLAPGLERELDQRAVLTVLDGGRGKDRTESFPHDQKAV
jgi:integrase